MFGCADFGHCVFDLLLAGEPALLDKLKQNLAAPKEWTIKGVKVDNAFSMTSVRDHYEGADGKGGFKAQTQPCMPIV